jgi:uncharacterized protein (UPF0332 family)
VVDVLRFKAGVLQTPTNGLSREARPMFYAVKALLLHGRYELSVHDQSGGRITMKGINSKNYGRHRDVKKG